MGKGANEPGTDTHASTLNDVYDAESTDDKHPTSNGYIHVDETEEHKSHDIDVRELSQSHKEALERQRQRRERKPLLYCKLITRWPLQSFCKYSFTIHIGHNLFTSVMMIVIYVAF